MDTKTQTRSDVAVVLVSVLAAVVESQSQRVGPMEISAAVPEALKKT